MSDRLQTWLDQCYVDGQLLYTLLAAYDCGDSKLSLQIQLIEHK